MTTEIQRYPATRVGNNRGNNQHSSHLLSSLSFVLAQDYILHEFICVGEELGEALFELGEASGEPFDTLLICLRTVELTEDLGPDFSDFRRTDVGMVKDEVIGVVEPPVVREFARMELVEPGGSWKRRGNRETDAMEIEGPKCHGITPDSIEGLRWPTEHNITPVDHAKLG